MRNKKLLLCIASILLSISSCAPVNNNQGNTPFTPEEDPVIVDPEPMEDTFVNPNSNPIEKPSSGTTTINVVSINDFHGAIQEERGVGLKKVGTYLRQQAGIENTLTLDQGDTWQGSIYSNYNHGQLINDVYSYAHVSARTVGNHDFDWGIEVLKHNTARSYAGYKTPVLAANVYDYDFTSKIEGNTQQSVIGDKSVSYTLKNGLKVGIVGTIGEKQITSIDSNNTHDVCFKSHVNIIKEEATSLRNNGCDVVIAACHADQDDLINNSLNEYVDLVLCAHSHQREEYQEDNLHYYQFGSYGNAIGKITLTYDYETNTITSVEAQTLEKSDLDMMITDIDQNVEYLVNHYNSQCDDAANVIVASNANDKFSNSNNLANLMCRALYDECVLEKYNVAFTYANQARSSIWKSTWTYSDLYQSFPFDNKVYIVDIYGSDILREVVNYNNVYYNPTFTKRVDPEKKYRIAVIDYLLFHTNTSRTYDYFRRFDESYVGILKNNYRVILKNWLIKNGYNKGALLNADDYDSKLSQFNRTEIIAE